MLAEFDSAIGVFLYLYPIRRRDHLHSLQPQNPHLHATRPIVNPQKHHPQPTTCTLHVAMRKSREKKEGAGHCVAQINHTRLRQVFKSRA